MTMLCWHPRTLRWDGKSLGPQVRVLSITLVDHLVNPKSGGEVEFYTDICSPNFCLGVSRFTFRKADWKFLHWHSYVLPSLERYFKKQIKCFVGAIPFDHGCRQLANWAVQMVGPSVSGLFCVRPRLPKIWELCSAAVRCKAGLHQDEDALGSLGCSSPSVSRRLVWTEIFLAARLVVARGSDCPISFNLA